MSFKLDTPDQEWLAYSVLPVYAEQMRRDRDIVLKADDFNETVRERLADTFKRQEERAIETAEKLEGAG